MDNITDKKRKYADIVKNYDPLSAYIDSDVNATMINFTKEENIDSLIEQSKILIIQFGTSTCAPCVAIKEKIDRWSREYNDVVTRYIDIEMFPEIAANQGIFSAPTIVVFIEGKLTVREAGYFSLEEIFQKVERYMRLM